MYLEHAVRQLEVGPFELAEPGRRGRLGLLQVGDVGGDQVQSPLLVHVLLLL